MYEDGLHQTITADATGASPAFQSVIDLAANLSKELEAVSVQGTVTGDTLTAGAVKAAEAHTVLGATIGKVETATNSAARAASALGFEVGSATARVTAMTEAFSALGKAAPELLALGAALIGIGAAVGFVRDAISGAAAMETELNTLGVAIRNQGGNWDQARKSVDAWASSLESATIFSRSEAISALNELVAAGVSESDAQKMVTVSTDVASGSHKTLMEVVDALKTAEIGRGIGLEKLDVNLKAVIKSHGTMHDALVILAHDFAGQASAATDTFEGKQKILHNTLESVAVTIGTALLPELEQGSDVLIALADTLKDNAGAFGAWAKDAVGDIKSVIDSVHSLWTLVSTENPLTSTPASIKKHSDDQGNVIKGIVNSLVPGMFFPEEQNMPEAPASKGPTGISSIDEKIEANRKKRLADQKKFWDEYVKHELDALDKNTTLGMGGSKKAKEEKAPPALIDLPDIEKMNAVVAGQLKLKSSLADLTESEVTLKNNVALATTEQGHAAAELALKTQIVKDAETATTKLNAQTKAEADEITRLTAVQNASRSAMESLAASHNNVAQMEGNHTAALTILDRDYKAAEKTWNDSIRTIATLTREREENNKQLSVESTRLLTVKEAQAAVSLAQDKAAAALATKNAEDLRHISDEENTYKKSISDQIAYYEQRLALIKSSGEDTYNETEKLTKQVESLELDAYKQRIDAAEAYAQAVQQKEKGVLDDLLLKHKSARDELKTIYDDIKTSFVNMVEQMVLKSTLLKEMPGIFGGMFGGTTDIGGKGKSKAALGGDVPSIPNVFSSMTSGGAGASNAPTGTASDPVYIQGTNAHLAALTGAQTGLTPGAGDGSGVPIIPAASMAVGIPGSGTSGDLTVMGPHGPITNSASVSYGGGGTGTAGRIAGGAAGAAMAVSGFRQGGVSGGIQAGLGVWETEAAINPLLAASPVGIGIAAGAGLIAGLTHHDNPSAMPDKYDTQNYGQGVANLGVPGGSLTANGQSFSENYDLQKSLGGVGELAAISNYIKSTGGTGLTSDQIAEFKNVTSVDPASLHNGNLTTNTGSVLNAEQLITQTVAALQVVQAAGGAPSYTISNTLPNQGSVTSQGQVVYPETTSGTGRPSALRTGGSIIADFRGATIVGPGGMDTASVAIGQSLQRAQTGQVAGTPSSALTNLRYGSII